MVMKWVFVLMYELIVCIDFVLFYFILFYFLFFCLGKNQESVYYVFGYQENLEIFLHIC